MPDKSIVSIVLLLKQPRKLSVEMIERAAADAYRGAPAPSRVVPMKAGMFGVLVGPMKLAVIMSPQPYFADRAAVANRQKNFPFRQAVLEHTAWLAVDLVGEPPEGGVGIVYDMIGLLIAELLSDDVLGLLRMPSGPGVPYDFSLIPMLRARKIDDVFTHGAPDRVIRTKPEQVDALAGAAIEARQRFGEFRTAFDHRRPDQKFATKACFEAGESKEHMWMELRRFDGQTLVGHLANDPQILKNLMQLGDEVRIDPNEIEDWMFTDGATTIGGFQAKVLRKA